MAEPGRTLGRYVVVREVGRGGMAVVYLAQQPDLGRDVALKELLQFHALDPAMAERFSREARVVAALSHPNIATVFDAFEHEGIPYIAVEYLERGSMRPFVKSLSLAQVVGVLEGLLAGLAHAHARGVVTPAYMAPEQALARGIGPWTDLYASGVIAYELLCGRTPFHDVGEPMAVMLHHVSEHVPPLRSLAPDVDERLVAWVERLLIKTPAERPPSAVDAWDNPKPQYYRLEQFLGADCRPMPHTFQHGGKGPQFETYEKVRFKNCGASFGVGMGSSEDGPTMNANLERFPTPDLTITEATVSGRRAKVAGTIASDVSGELMIAFTLPVPGSDAATVKRNRYPKAGRYETSVALPQGAVEGEVSVGYSGDDTYAPVDVKPDSAEPRRAGRRKEPHRRRSGSSGDVCLEGMQVTYLVVTILVALANGYAAALNFVGAESVKVVADRVQVSRGWMVPLGTLLAAGAVGLLTGFAVPVLGTAAAIGLVVYFICAVTAHLRVRDRQIGGAVFFLLLAVAALTTDVAYHNRW
jgi:hypothetical protein